MELTVHERNIFRQPLSKPELRELLTGSPRLFGFNRRRIECPLR
jgi:hypothetical protein